MEHATDLVAYRSVVDFRVLGPVVAFEGDEPVRLGGPKQRTVLAHLLADAGRIVPDDVLIQGVWGPEASPGVPDHIAIARHHGTILIMTPDVNELIDLARDRVIRSLTEEERQIYLHGQCPEE